MSETLTSMDGRVKLPNSTSWSARPISTESQAVSKEAGDGIVPELRISTSMSMVSPALAWRGDEEFSMTRLAFGVE
jgi:hypothetical protein